MAERDCWLLSAAAGAAAQLGLQRGALPPLQYSATPRPSPQPAGSCRCHRHHTQQTPWPAPHAAQAVEKRDAGAQPANGGPEDPRYYANLEAHIQHDLEEVPLGKSEDELWAEGLLSRAAGDLAASVEAAGELGGAARGAAAGATAAGGWARGAAAQAGAEESRDGLEARRRS